MFGKFGWSLFTIVGVGLVSRRVAHAGPVVVLSAEPARIEVLLVQPKTKSREDEARASVAPFAEKSVSVSIKNEGHAPVEVDPFDVFVGDIKCSRTKKVEHSMREALDRPLPHKLGPGHEERIEVPLQMSDLNNVEHAPQLCTFRVLASIRVGKSKRVYRSNEVVLNLSE